MGKRVSRRRVISGEWRSYVVGVEASERRPTQPLLRQSQSSRDKCQRGPFTPLHPSTRFITPIVVN